MSNELIKSDEFSVLPAIHINSRERIEKAKAYTTLQLSAVLLVNLQEVDAVFMEGLLVPVINLRALLVEAKGEIEAARKPFTQRMDAVKKLFTAIEAEFEEQIQKVATVQNKWELEKLNRQRISDQKAEQDLAKKQAKINGELRMRNDINQAFAQLLVTDMQRMTEKYYSKTSAELAEFGQAIKAWNPALYIEDYVTMSKVHCNILHHSLEECTEILKTIAEELYPGLADEYTTKMSEKRDYLVDLIPSRIIELTEGDPVEAAQRIADEKAETLSTVMAVVGEKLELNTMNADTEKLSAHFEVMPSGPVLEKAKGAVVKQKYVATSHKAIAAILQSWVKNSMPKLTIPEIEKKLSFMFTAANDRLNDKKNPERLEAEGLNVIDDVSTRNAKAKA